MNHISSYLDTNSTIYPDGFVRETFFRSSGDMVSPPPQSRATSLFQAVIEAFSDWRIKRAGRLVLREMDEDRLSDIGFTREQAAAEVRKSFFID